MGKEKNLTEATININGEIYNVPYDVAEEIIRQRVEKAALEELNNQILELQAELKTKN